MKLCERESLLKLLPESEIQFYPNSLCFEDLNKFKLTKGWMDADFHSIYLSFDYCNPNTYHGTCKNHTEIEEFLSKNLFTMINQRTMVDKKIYG